MIKSINEPDTLSLDEPVVPQPPPKEQPKPKAKDADDDDDDTKPIGKRHK